MIKKPKTKKPDETRFIDKKAFALGFLIGDVEYKISHNDTDRIVNVDGRKTFKKSYDLHISSSSLDLSKDVYTFKVLEVLDYGKKKYTIIFI
mgnify:FL=1